MWENFGNEKKKKKDFLHYLTTYQSSKMVADFHLISSIYHTVHLTDLISNFSHFLVPMDGPVRDPDILSWTGISSWIVDLSGEFGIHSVSKEIHREFIHFPCDPRSKSSAPWQGHIWLQEFGTGHKKKPYSNILKSPRVCLVRKTAQIPLQYTQFQKKRTMNSFPLWPKAKVIFDHENLIIFYEKQL